MATAANMPTKREDVDGNTIASSLTASVLERFDLREAMAIKECLESLSPILSEVASLGHLEKLKAVETSYLIVFQRLLKEDGLVLIERTAGFRVEDHQAILQAADEVLDSRGELLESLIGQWWSARVATVLRDTMVRQTDRDLEEALKTRLASLALTMASSRQWLKIELSQKLRNDLDQQEMHELNRKAHDASLRASEATIRMAGFAKQTTVLTWIGAIVAGCALSAYGVQAYYAKQQAKYAGDQVLLTKCAPAEDARVNALPDVVCPAPVDSKAPGIDTASPASASPATKTAISVSGIPVPSASSPNPRSGDKQ